ncbi:Os06g0298000, partial [Oryza sativa Japonica Group]
TLRLPLAPSPSPPPPPPPPPLPCTAAVQIIPLFRSTLPSLSLSLSLSLSTQSTHPPPPHGSGELAAGDRRRNPRVSSCVRGRWFCSNDRRWWCRRQPPLPPPARSGGRRLGFGGRCHPLPSIPSSPTFRSINKAMDELRRGPKFEAAALDWLKICVMECIDKYGDDYQYSTDPRLLKIWILYVIDWL